MTLGSRRCLLLVDDDPRNLMALDAILSPLGHRLVHANDLASRHAALARLQGEHRELMEFIVHDIAAPMMSLKSSVEWVEGHFDEGITVARPVFAEMRTSLERVGVMIDDLSWVSRLESCTLPVRRAPVAMNDLVGQAVRRVERVAAARRIELELRCAEHVSVHADAGLLARVLDNLLDNALRYTADGGRIRVELRRDDGVEIRVCNDGVPIPVSERSRIFEKFVRGSGEPPSPGNPGLGLYFCKRAVGAHQGELHVVDEPDWGTCFALWLPSSGSAPGQRARP